MVEKSAENSALVIALAMVWEDWMHAQWMSMDEDKRMEMEEHKDEMLSLFGF